MRKFSFALIFVLAALVSLSTGCSKSETALVGAAALSGVVGGGVVLKGHLKRNKIRKQDLFNYRYKALETSDG